MKMSFAFFKKGDMRFISHLDLMRLFQRAFRRADLGVVVTKGFNPHPKFSIGRALKLGLESEAEEAVLYLQKAIAPEEFRERLNNQLPEGIKIRYAKADTD